MEQIKTQREISRTGGKMKNIPISKVCYEMLLSISKDMRMKPQAVIEEYIKTTFNKKR